MIHRRLHVFCLMGMSVSMVLALASCGAQLPVAPVVQVTPSAVTLQAGGGTQQFKVALIDSPTQNVVWKVNGILGGNSTFGTITQSGLYSAPAAVPTGTVTVTAVSEDNANSTGSATVTLTAAVSLTLSPATATANPGQAVQFTATVANAGDTAVTWSVNGTAGGSATVGTISATGLYTAPATFPGTSQVTVTAASVQDPQVTASATVSLTQPVTVAVNPTSVIVNLGATQAFTAQVTGNTNTAVNWSVNGIAGGNAANGTIDANGLFTAPQQMPPNPKETVTATSQADTQATGSAQLTLQVPPSQFSISPATASLTLAKAASGTQAYQVALSPGFGKTVTLTASGLPPNVTAVFAPASITASGPVTLTLTTASISLANNNVPVTITAASTDASGNPVVQTATVLLTITGWAGQVHVISGGPGGIGFEDGGGTADELQASGIVSDGGQNLYFSDERGEALRAFSLTGNTVSTLDGAGPFTFTFPEGEGMAYDPGTQTIYVADALRNQILAFTIGGFTPKVVAGGLVAGYTDAAGTAAAFSFPHGMAISPDDSTLYIADTNNEVIRALNLASGAVTTLAGQHGVFRSTDGTGAAASFCQPTGLAIDAAGANLYVSDQCGYKIRQIAIATGAVTTVAGSGQIGQADGPAAAATFSTTLAGLAVDPHAAAGLVYIADGNAIRALKLGATPTVFTVAGALASGSADGSNAFATFYAPQNLSALDDAAGPNSTTLFVADTSNGLLRRLDILNPTTATSASNVSVTVSTLAGQPPDRGRTDGAGTGPNFTSASTANFDLPQGIVTDGKIAYVADANNGAIRRIDLSDGSVSTVAGPGLGYTDGPAGQANFYEDAGLAWDAAHNVIYIADTGNGAIRKLDLNANTVSTLAGASASGYVDGPLLQARFNHPYGILVSSDGTQLYIGDTGNNVIRQINLTTGQVSTIAGNGGLGASDGVGSAARFSEPAGMAWDATGTKIYIADFENEDIRQLDLSNDSVSTLAGFAHKCGSGDGSAASASLCHPAMVASDGRSIFWGDSDTGLLRVLDLGTNTVYTLAGQPELLHMQDGAFTEVPGTLNGPVRYNGPFGIAIAPDDSFILFTEKTANVVRIIK